MTQVTIHQAKTTLSKLVSQVETGDEVIVCRGHVPVAKLVPYCETPTRRPRVGEITSKPVKVRPGCFAPLTDKEMAEWGME